MRGGGGCTFFSYRAKKVLKWCCPNITCFLPLCPNMTTWKIREGGGGGGGLVRLCFYIFSAIEKDRLILIRLQNIVRHDATKGQNIYYTSRNGVILKVYVHVYSQLLRLIIYHRPNVILNPRGDQIPVRGLYAVQIERHRPTCLLQTFNWTLWTLKPQSHYSDNQSPTNDNRQPSTTIDNQLPTKFLIDNRSPTSCRPVANQLPITRRSDAEWISDHH